MAFLARIDLMWNGLSFQWFTLLQPSTCFSNVFHYDPINLAQGMICIEKKELNLYQGCCCFYFNLKTAVSFIFHGEELLW